MVHNLDYMIMSRQLRRSMFDMQCMQLYTHATLFRYLHNHYDNADVYKA